MVFTLFHVLGKPKSTAFDLSLMIFLIRKYTDIKVSNQLPVAKKRKGTDISTVMYYWKEIAGEQDCVLSNQTFEEYWTAITDVRFLLALSKQYLYVHLLIKLNSCYQSFVDPFNNIISISHW